jgi:putative copper export protein
VLPVTADTVRVFLHVLGATVWVGGQVVLAGIVPVVRRDDAALVRVVARRFQQIAWPAFALLVATGVWNVLDRSVGDQTTEWQATLAAKLVWVALSGIAAAFHALVTGPSVAAATDERERRRRRALSGISAALALVFALLATFTGVQLSGR